jgi:hypothetical protein
MLTPCIDAVRLALLTNDLSVDRTRPLVVDMGLTSVSDRHKQKLYEVYLTRYALTQKVLGRRCPTRFTLAMLPCTPKVLPE